MAKPVDRRACELIHPRACLTQSFALVLFNAFWKCQTKFDRHAARKDILEVLGYTFAQLTGCKLSECDRRDIPRGYSCGQENQHTPRKEGCFTCASRGLD